MTTVFEEQNISKAVFRMGLPAMKRFVKCFFELLTENFSAWQKKERKTRL